MNAKRREILIQTCGFGTNISSTADEVFLLFSDLHVMYWESMEEKRKGF